MYIHPDNISSVEEATFELLSSATSSLDHEEEESRKQFDSVMKRDLINCQSKSLFISFDLVIYSANTVCNSVVQVLSSTHNQLTRRLSINTTSSLILNGNNPILDTLFDALPCYPQTVLQTYRPTKSLPQYQYLT